MKIKHPLLAMAMSALLLTGCGSDSDSSSTPPTTTDPVESTPATGTGAFDYAKVWGPDVNWQIENPFYAYIDEVAREDMLRQFQGTGIPENGFKVDPADLRERKMASLAAGDGKYIENAAYNDNQITFADVLLYLSDTVKGFSVDYQFDEQLNAYQWQVTWDADGDGTNEYESDPDWYATYMIDFAEFRREKFYDAQGEALYLRLEDVLVENNSGVLFKSFSPAMTERREQVQLDQAERRRNSKPSYYSEDTDVIIVPSVMLIPIEEFGVAGGTPVMLQNVEARSHNLRPDIYKKDQAITMADVMLSINEQELAQVGYSFWGTLESGVELNHFVINEVNGKRKGGAHGYVINTGVSYAMNDFAAKYLVPGVVGHVEISESYCDHNGTSNYLDPSDTSTDYPDGLIDAEPSAASKELHCNPETTDVEDWFVDQEFHLFSDVWLMNNPGDTVTVVNFHMYDYYPPSESKRVAGDGQWPEYDARNAKFALDDTHFGWGIANCGNCHSLSGIHSEGDIGADLGVNPKIVDIYDTGKITSHPVDDVSELVIAPYQCAECHGSNGAPNGHGEFARCYWCHAEDVVPENHGSVSTYITRADVYGADADKLGGNSPALYNRAYESIAVNSADEAAMAELTAEVQGWDHQESTTFDMLAPNENVNWEGFWGMYPADMKIRTNNDWMTDPTYPDPYACVTCHYDK
ncbi:hypothetical protein [Ferrimonas lipolytica]|uniref:Uncharacterized protein n=1 Tax=Ferrimonas lipolytica TaxID=2724191 RepID=A0A6H1UB29_9GAMM|nr:hypothetical protein [Ferrimonas lipolytica]QIZ76261.1 hypothetical protein HER31_04755 [Ferrimonas lipolytica]